MGNLYLPQPTVNYGSPSCPTHPAFLLQVYLPTGTPNVEGWPVVFWFNSGGFNSSSLFASIGDPQVGLQAQLDGKRAVVVVMGPVCRGGQTGNIIGDANTPFDPANNLWGPAYPGSGLITVYNGPHFADPAYFQCHKSGAMALQYIVEQVQLGNLPFDLTRITLAGRSNGGWIASYIFYSPNMAPFMFPGGTGRDAISTRIVRDLMIDATPGYMPIFDLDDATVAGGSPVMDFIMWWFPTLASGAASDVPCDLPNQASLSVKYNTSPLVIGAVAPEGNADATTDAENHLRHAYMSSGSVHHAGAPYSSNLSTGNQNYTQAVQAANETTPLPAGGAELAGHSPWPMAAYKTRYGAMIRTVVFDTTGMSDATFAALVDAVIEDAAARALDQVTTLNTWQDYVWPAPVPDPIEHLVLNAVELALKQIKLASGYRTDVQAVFRFEDLKNAAHAYPCIQSTALESSYDDSVLQNRIQGMLRISLDLILDGWTDKTLRTSCFIADVRKRLQLQFEADSFGGLVNNIHVTAAGRWMEPDDQLPLCGAKVIYDIEFRDKLADPYSTG